MISPGIFAQGCTVVILILMSKYIPEEYNEAGVLHNEGLEYIFEEIKAEGIEYFFS